MLAQHRGGTVGRPFSIGRHPHSVSLAQQPGHLLHRSRRIADGRGPAPHRHHRGRRPGRYCGHGPHRRRAGGQQPVVVHMQTGELFAGRSPGLGQRTGQVGLLGGDVGRPVPEPPRFQQHHQGIGAETVGDDLVGVDQPWQPRFHPVEELALRQALPLLPTPGAGGHQPLGRGPNRRHWPHLPSRKYLNLLPRLGGTLIGHRELGEAVNLIAPQIDADRAVGGRREHIHDGTPHREHAPVLHLHIAPVAPAGQVSGQLAQINPIARCHPHWLGIAGIKHQSLKQGPHRGHQNRRALLGVVELPDGLATPAHRLHSRADPLERQGLPRREQGDTAVEHRRQVAGQALGVGSSGRGHHHWSAAVQLGDGGQHRSLARLGHGQRGVASSEHVDHRGLVSQQPPKASQTRPHTSNRGGH